MCGIVGYVGPKSALEVILEGLRKLEYRGYDSAGVALVESGRVVVTRAPGKLEALRQRFQERRLQERQGQESDGGLGLAEARVGLGHTRWATHGKPSERNAHPHSAGRVSLIHNGIIENYGALRSELQAEGRTFSSETDTEVAAHLYDRELKRGAAPLEAFRAMCKRLEGSYALLAIDEQHPDRILVAKTATPIVIGVGEGEAIVASDIPAVLEHTRRVIILEDGDIADVRADEIYIENHGVPVLREPKTITWDPITAQKGGYKHFMLKEIFEQPVAIADTVRGRLESVEGGALSRVDLSELSISDAEIRGIKRIVLLGCGTAWHACLTAKFYIESLARIPCEVDYASEYRYRQPIFEPGTIVLAISQSGETADTVAAVELAAKQVPTYCICNVVGSSLTRKVRDTLYTRAGPEIGVASTKAFTTQLTAAFLLAVYLGEKRGALNAAQVSKLAQDVAQLTGAVEESLGAAAQCERVAKEFHSASDFLYLGRGVCYPIALEGALKLKEISYIHAEGYPSGEMKHGPLALIDEKLPVVVLVQNDRELFAKSLSNLREAESRGGRIISITDRPGQDGKPDAELTSFSEVVLEVPFISTLLSPIVMTIPLQFISYYVAVQKGTDVDLPRNLAKSVTVE